MADRTAAYLFGRIFTMLAEENIDREARAKEFWQLSRDFDFSAYQMGCDEALKKLGLAQ